MFDDASVMWIDADYIHQNCNMPLSTFQKILFSIPSIHRKMVNDIGNPPSCQFPPNNNTVKYMVDIYGAAVLALRCPSIFSDQLLTTFIVNNYMNHCGRQRPCQPPCNPSCPCQPPCKPPCRSPCRPPSDCAQILETLEKLGHQSDLLINGVNQISINQSAQFMELSNMLCALRTQNTQIITTLNSVVDKLNSLIDELKAALPDQSDALEELAEKLTEVINAVAQTLRSEMNNTNSILTNLASSITNINSTLNNLLTTIEGLGGGLTDADNQKLSDILDLVTEIRSILMGSRK